MEREIKFRGKRVDNVDNGKWVYGYYHKECSGAVFITEEANLDVYNRQMVRAVSAETVGQFTGLRADSRNIYEGDILKLTNGQTGKVIWSWSSFKVFILETNEFYECENAILKDAIIVGNIHDNPELLKTE